MEMAVTTTPTEEEVFKADALFIFENSFQTFWD